MAHLNEITGQIVDAAIAVHTCTGPGLLESAYEAMLAHELVERGMEVQRQVSIPINYRQLLIPDAFRADLVISSAVIVELKSVERLLPLHGKQVMTYLRLSQLPAALLMNFNVRLLKDGIERFVNGPVDPSSVGSASSVGKRIGIISHRGHRAHGEESVP